MKQLNIVINDQRYIIQKYRVDKSPHPYIKGITSHAVISVFLHEPYTWLHLLFKGYYNVSHAHAIYVASKHVCISKYAIQVMRHKLHNTKRNTSVQNVKY